MTVDDFTECLRCGAMVDQTAKHRRWHEHLEGTSAELPKDPNEKPGLAWGF